MDDVPKEPKSKDPYAGLPKRLGEFYLPNLQAGFSLTSEVEGHCLMNRQLPSKIGGQRPEPLGGRGACSPGKFLERKSPRSVFSCNLEKESCYDAYLFEI